MQRSVSQKFLPLNCEHDTIKSNQISKEKIFATKRLKRCQNNSILSNICKKQSIKQNSQDKNNDNNLKYTPLKLNVMKQTNSTTMLKTPRTNVNSTDLHHDQTDYLKLNKLKKPKVQEKTDRSSSQYYKFWKNKATQYQQANFNLQKINSALQQQLSILKHHNQRLQRKIKRKSPEDKQIFDDPLQKQKLQRFYQIKVDFMSKKIEQQQIVMAKQDQKIKQLSKQMSQNYKLKNLLSNMEDRVSEMESVDENKSMRSYRMKSVNKIVLPPKMPARQRNSSFTNLSIKRPETLRYMVPQNKNYVDKNSLALQKSRSNYDLNLNLQSQQEFNTSLDQHF